MSNKNILIVQKVLETPTGNISQISFNNKLTLSDPEISEIIKYILHNDKNRELIENNLYYLKNKQNTPNIYLKIYQEYTKVLESIQNKVELPKSYTYTVLDYVQKVTKELTSSFKEIAQNVNEHSRELENQTKRIDDQAKKFEKKLDRKSKKLEKKLNVSQADAVKQIHKSKDSIILLTVTVLGIFSSLTFSLSGSLSMLNNVFSVENMSFAEAIFKFAMIGLFVSNLVFLLIYTISKLNNKSIAMHCSKCKDISYICQECNIRKKDQNNDFKYKIECHGCEHKNTSCQDCTYDGGFFCKMRYKFSYIFYINILCLIALGGSFLMGITGHGDFVFKESVIEERQTVETENDDGIHLPPENENANSIETLKENIPNEEGLTEDANLKE